MIGLGGMNVVVFDCIADDSDDRDSEWTETIFGLVTMISVVFVVGSLT